MSGIISKKMITDGLVLYLDAANTKSFVSGSTVWNDLSKSSEKGIIYNAPTFSSSNNGILLFDGTNEYVDFGTTPTNTIRGGSQFTISYWVKKIASDRDIIVGSWKHSVRQGFFLEWYTDGNIYFGNSAGGANNNVAPLTWTNGWYQIVGVFDGSQATNATKGKIYVNGQLLNQSNSGLNTTVVTSTLTKFYVGFVENYDIYSNAYFSTVLLYNRALSATEILQNYNAIKKRFGL
jgi:hypothetical protein